MKAERKAGRVIFGDDYISEEFLGDADLFCSDVNVEGIIETWDYQCRIAVRAVFDTAVRPLRAVYYADLDREFSIAGEPVNLAPSLSIGRLERVEVTMWGLQHLLSLIVCPRGQPSRAALDFEVDDGVEPRTWTTTCEYLEWMHQQIDWYVMCYDAMVGAAQPAVKLWRTARNGRGSTRNEALKTLKALDNLPDQYVALRDADRTDGYTVEQAARHAIEHVEMSAEKRIIELRGATWPGYGRLRPANQNEDGVHAAVAAAKTSIAAAQTKAAIELATATADQAIERQGRV